MKKIPEPESQLQEVLYELINRLYIDRKTMMLSCDILNLTARIANLRRKGVKIIANEVKGVNKYGREITFAKWSLDNKIQAREVYLELKKNQAGIPEA